jgi:hypothetical protein
VATRSLGRGGAAVLFTDGAPTVCQEPLSVAALADAAGAASAAERAAALTFVVNVGPDLCELHQVAIEGGTERALVVQDGDLAGPLVDAITRWTAPGISCAFSVPDAPSTDLVIDLEQARVLYTPDLRVPTVVQELPRVDGYLECLEFGGGGWYLEGPSDKRQMVLCPCSCELTRFGFLDMQFGCLEVGVPL